MAKSKTPSNVTNPSLYSSVKWLVKTYKKRGGGYKGAKKAAGGAVSLANGGAVMQQGRGCGAMMQNKRKKTKVPRS